MKVYEGERVPIKNWCSLIEESARKQIFNLAKLPFVFHHIAIMPDCHSGYGMPIGGVLATEGVIIPYAVGVDIGCFSGDTKVPLLNGTQKTLKELTDIGKEIYIYSLDEKLNFVPGKAIPKLTRKNQELLEITISGGEIVKCTLDHKFMMKDGTYKEAKDLKVHDSLMPLYRHYSNRDGYEHIKTTMGTSIVTHRMVAQSLLGLRKDNELIHHKDNNLLNNDPTNLEYKDKEQHSKDHRISNPIFGTKEFKEKRLKILKEKGFFDIKLLPKKRKVAIENWNNYNKSEQAFINTRGNGLRGKKYLINYNKSAKGRAKSIEISNRLYECEICNEKIKSPIGLYNHKLKNHSNHKVLSVKKLNYKEDVYCLTVEKYHNFALSAGVFVHNCGMCAVKTSLKAEQLDKETLKKIFGGSAEYQGGIRSAIPLGFNHHSKKQDADLMPPFPSSSIGIENGYFTVVLREYESALKQIGTLGGGNHFIEIQKDIEGYVWVMIHSGSRNLGKQVADHYNKIAIDLNKRWHTSIPKEWQLAFLPIESKEGNDYMREMNYCVEFALANRKLMMERIIEAFRDAGLRLSGFNIDVDSDRSFDVKDKRYFVDGNEINIAHNYAQFENHFGKNVIVHRKGATLARKDTIGIIPGSQGSKSYIVKGLGNEDSFMSCSHGAGRKMSRTKACNELDLVQEIKKLDDQGIVHGIRTKNDLDEASGAYKDIDIVMSEQKDLVEIIYELNPIAVIKG